MREADADVREFGRLAERLGQPLYSWYVPLWRGAAAHLAGDLDMVARCAEEVRPRGPGDSRNADVLGIVQGVWSLIERGPPPRRWPDHGGLRRLPELAPDGGSLIMLFHGSRTTCGCAPPPPARLLAGCRRTRSGCPTSPASSGAPRGRPRRRAGGAPLRELAPYAHLFLVDGIGAGLAGSVERSLGELAMLVGDHDAAVGHFERALDGQHQDRGAAGGRQHPPRVRRAVAAAWRPG